MPLLRTSERAEFKRCRWRWHLSYVRNLKPEVDANALRFGTLWHQAMAAYYIPGIKRGVPPAQTFEKLYAEELKRMSRMHSRGEYVDSDEKFVDLGELGVAMAEHYVAVYGRDSEWEVLVTEHPFQRVVKDEQGDWYVYVGVIDLIMRHRPTRKIYIWDHKSTASIGGTTAHPKFPEHLRIDDQAGAYWSHGLDWIYANGLLKPGIPLAGMMYNFARKAKPDDRPKNEQGHYLNKDGTISKKQPAPYFYRPIIYRDEFDRERAKERADWDMAEITLAKEGKLPLTKNPGMFTCNGCWAIDACELHETGHDWETFLGSVTRPWDPYAEHETYDQEARH